MTEALWYTGRASGVVSLVLFTAVVILGIAGRSGRPAFGLPRFAVVAVHRYASLLAVAFLALHVGTLLFDPYATLRIADLVVPFGSGYRPLWIGLGTVAADLIAALVITSLLRHRIGVRAWRAIHWLAYAAWPAAVLHGIEAGTDSGARWIIALTGTCAVAVFAAVAWRISPRFAAAGSATQAHHPVHPDRSHQPAGGSR
jgi:sulfoxide reductase heme-binding subunit YedZ